MNAGALIYIEGTTAKATGCVIDANLVAVFPPSDALSLVKLGNTGSCSLRANTISAGAANVKGIAISSTSTDTVVEQQTFNIGQPLADRIVNAGIGTAGVQIAASLASPWTVSAGFDAPSFHKSPTGIVSLNGTAQRTSGSTGLMFTLPDAYRPSSLVRCVVATERGASFPGTAGFGIVEVATTGAVSLTVVGGSGSSIRVSLNSMQFVVPTRSDGTTDY
mgnify:CR=1 FL=1